MINFGKRLKNLRQQRELTQNQLADMLGISRDTLIRWEIGGHEPRLSDLFKIAEVFNVSIEKLIKEEGVNTKEEDTQIRTKTTNFKKKIKEKANFSYWGEVVDKAQEAANNGNIKEISIIKSLLAMATDIIIDAENKNKLSSASIIVNNNGNM